MLVCWVPKPSQPAHCSTGASDYVPVVSDVSSISSMDEISYWIYTKRAPCLLNLDSLVKGGDEHKSTPSIPEDAPSPKKKRKKISLLDDESVSIEKQPNLYFEATKISENQLVIKGNCESGSSGSDISFNIKKSSVQDKQTKTRLRNNSRTTLHKKNKIVTSTPKPANNLRRSLRKAQFCVNINSQFNRSFEVLNCTVSNNNSKPFNVKGEDNITEMHTGGDQTVPNKQLDRKVTKQVVPHNHYEDLSDVSGFTANYIRSTKIAKTPRKLKCKTNKNLMKESPLNNSKDESKMVVCVNKSVNTGLPQTPLFNCSTDSSQNVINLVTVKRNNTSSKVNRSTSLLKFMNSKNSNSNEDNINDVLINKANVDNPNVSVLSQSNGSSRYPKRHKNNICNPPSTKEKVPEKNKNVTKTPSDFNCSDRKENPEEKQYYRTRSGRMNGTISRQPENSVLVLSNSVEQVSSAATMNVASPTCAGHQCSNRGRRKRASARQTNYIAKCVTNCKSSRKETLRDKSGFSACFSDSDNESATVNQKKFFC